MFPFRGSIFVYSITLSLGFNNIELYNHEEIKYLYTRIHAISTYAYTVRSLPTFYPVLVFKFYFYFILISISYHSHISYICIHMYVLLGDNVDTTKKNTQTLIDASKEIDLRVNTEETKHVLLSCHQNAGHDIII
jgi:hypothetical protein